YPMPREKEAAAADLQRYRRIAGKYEFSAGYVVSVTEEGGKLFAVAPDQPKSELIPDKDGSFFSADDDVVIQFVEDEKGRVTTMVATQGGQKFSLKRLEQSSAHASSPKKDP